MLQAPTSDPDKSIGGRLTMVLADEGTSVQSTFTMIPPNKLLVNKRLVLPTKVTDGLELTAEVRVLLIDFPCSFSLHEELGQKCLYSITPYQKLL